MHDAMQCLYCQFPEALRAGLLISAVCAMLGVFVILKRAVFIGITLSEVATCGVAAAFLLGIPPFAGSLALVLAAVGALAIPFDNQRIPRDTLMGIIFIAASALAVLLVSKSGTGLMEVNAVLYGDLILASKKELAILFAVLVPALAGFLLFLRPSLYSFLDREAAKVLGIRTWIWETLFFLMLGAVISATSQIAGALLVFCYLVVCPATALVLSKRIKVVLALAPLLGMLATFLGMVVSFNYDLPTNQTICIIACILFVVGAGVKRLVSLSLR
ncbi:High-affinity zinc uptake system membrane protein ZnuB [Pontiella desulfatans]|uniref:High-affinity zinc uptake system membrane protein ZnuB n=1 Tax=Pontiella desulfatans TaxID=2750659 RepID=A0A6C2UEG5_PONDE|nr:metal ABC transporter permease [Pontiella desulfatans]VGO17606.1 High-affinity zinc uptake system membrane protein ZnuB [Pontiella desulfatans]